MTREDNQKMKILYILKILWEESDELHILSAEQIAKKVASYGIHCERKSVYKCLTELTEFGFDIIRTKRGAYMATRMFELPELKLLADAVQSSKFITEKKSDELIAKIGTLLSRYESEQLHRQVFVKNRVKTMNESIYYNIDTIYEGIRGNRQVAFDYWNWNAKKEMVYRHDRKRYIISPWFLQWEDEKYYLVGYEDLADKMKHFRVDKMYGITILESPRNGKKLFDQMNPASYGTLTFGMFQGRRETVTLSMKNELAGVVIDRFGKEVWMHSLDEGHFTVVLDVMVSNQFFGWLTGLGEGVTITGPMWVKEEYGKLLRRLMDSYE